MFAGKVVLVTGASSGIGATIAVHFAKEGAALAITARTEKKLEKTAENCLAVGKKKPLLIVADLSKDDDLSKIINETIKTYGKLDVLINNAGICISGGFQETTTEQMDKMYGTNLRAVYGLTQLAVPHLIASKGNVVNISSVGGIRPLLPVFAYSMLKAALDHFARLLSMELAPKQVRVNNVNPGAVKTEIYHSTGITEKEYVSLLERNIETHPLGRIGTTDDVANAVLFLAGDGASFITGETICIDGGKQNICPL